MIRRLGWLSFMFGASMGGTTLVADAILWDADRAVIQGTGCQKDVDSFASANGDELAIVFTNLGVDLAGGDGGSNAMRRNCTVRVPAQISQGLYIGTLTQRLTFGVTKTRYSQGSLATRSSFFGATVNPYIVDIPYGRAINVPLMERSRIDNFLVNTPWARDWCRPTRNPRGFYHANMAVSGQRDSRHEDLIMFVDGLDLKFEFSAVVRSCGL